MARPPVPRQPEASVGRTALFPALCRRCQPDMGVFARCHFRPRLAPPRPGVTYPGIPAGIMPAMRTTRPSFHLIPDLDPSHCVRGFRILVAGAGHGYGNIVQETYSEQMENK